MSKVLVLYTSVGMGIKTTAQSVAEILQRAGHEVRVVDFQKQERGLLAFLSEKIYHFFLETVPFVWEFLYYSRIVEWITLPLRKVVAALKSKRLRKLIETYQPDIVVSTQTAPSGVMAYLKSKGKFSGKLVIVFSDYHLHRFWLYKECDLYICSVDDQARALLRLGISKEKIIVTGMIIADKYFEKISREKARKTFELDPDLPTILISGGNRGTLIAKKIIRELLQSRTRFQIVAVAGSNAKIHRELEALRQNSSVPMKVLGFIRNQDELMSATDVIVTKPGGPTIAEAVAKGLPVVISGTHVGHERANREFLEKAGLVDYQSNPRSAAHAVLEILTKKRVSENMPSKSRAKILRSDAANILLKAIDRVCGTVL